MKKSKLILLFICIANFGVANAEQEMLSKIQLFQAIDKAEPLVLSQIKAACKGIVEYSQDSADSKACTQNSISLIEEAQNVTTEEQAQLFATHFKEVVAACKTIGLKNMEKNLNKHKNNQLPLIQIAQHAIKAFPNESAIILISAVIETDKLNALDPLKAKSKEIIETIAQLPNITTEEQAQDFTQKLGAILYDTPHGKVLFDNLNAGYQAALNDK